MYIYILCVCKVLCTFLVQICVHALFSVCISSFGSNTAAELSVVVCSPSNVGTLLEGHSTYPGLQHVVTWGNPQPEHVLKLAEECGVTLHSVDEVEVSGGAVSDVTGVKLPYKCVCVDLWLMLFDENPGKYALCEVIVMMLACPHLHLPCRNLARITPLSPSPLPLMTWQPSATPVEPQVCFLSSWF